MQIKADKQAARFLKREETIEALEEVEKVGAGLWRSCHCGESQWHLSQGSDFRTGVESLFPIPYAAVLLEDEGIRGMSGLLGSVGSGTLTALNLFFSESLRAKLASNQEVITQFRRLLKDSEVRGSFVLRMMTYVYSDRSTVDTVITEIAKKHYSVEVVVSEIYQARPDLRWMLLKTMVVLLNATRSAATAVCKANTSTNRSGLVCSDAARSPGRLDAGRNVCCAVHAIGRASCW